MTAEGTVESNTCLYAMKFAIEQKQQHNGDSFKFFPDETMRQEIQEYDLTSELENSADALAKIHNSNF